MSAFRLSAAPGPGRSSDDEKASGPESCGSRRLRSRPPRSLWRVAFWAPHRFRGLRPMKPPQAPSLPDELDRLMRRMRFPYMRRAAPEVCATARSQRWDPTEVLRVLIAEEVIGRDSATRKMRRHAAGFPSGKTFESWREE